MHVLKGMLEEIGVEFSEKIFRNEESIAGLGTVPFVSVHKFCWKVLPYHAGLNSMLPPKNYTPYTL